MISIVLVSYGFEALSKPLHLKTQDMTIKNRGKTIPSYYILSKNNIGLTPSQQRANSYLKNFNEPKSPYRLALLYVYKNYWNEPGDIDGYFNQGYGFYLADYLTELHRQITDDPETALTYYIGIYDTQLSSSAYLNLKIAPKSDVDATSVITLSDTVINNVLYFKGNLSWDFNPPSDPPNKTACSIDFKSNYDQDGETGNNSNSFKGWLQTSKDDKKQDFIGAQVTPPNPNWKKHKSDYGQLALEQLMCAAINLALMGVVFGVYKGSKSVYNALKSYRSQALLQCYFEQQSSLFKIKIVLYRS